jgi:hypothetical protein
MTVFKTNPGLNGWMKDNVRIVHDGMGACGEWPVLAAAVWPFAMTALLGVLDRYLVDGQAPDQHGLMMLFYTIEGIVGRKKERFSDTLHTLADGKNDADRLDGGTVFLKITQPVDQMKSIMQGLLIFFKGIQTGKDSGLRVSLIELTNGHPKEFVCFYPEDRGPRSAIKDLDSPKSAVMQAVKNRHLVVIEDIRKGAKAGNFRITDATRKDEPGSMMCYPVDDRISQKPVLVISVCSDVPGYFSRKSAKMYDWVLAKFANRLLLEYNLLRLRRRVEEV